MKIDIHTHTRKCKSGDAQSREITPEDFCDVVTSTDVGIIAITNHNVFDLSQFEQIESLVGEEVQVWPGVELDVIDESRRGHLLVIVSPKLSKEFNSVVTEMTKELSPDQFTTTIEKIIDAFDELNPLYVAHYKKVPMISDSSLKMLEENTNNPQQVLKEVSNSISAGIYISHGYASIYGTDIHDWSKYRELSRELPDLRLPVDSFEHFCLLLKKDPTTINTLLDRKNSEKLVLHPFPDGTALDITIFHDINVVFGPKGTGKSCILRAIARYYSENGIDTTVYESASDRLDEIFDIKGKDLALDLNEFGINYCTNEIESLRNAGEVGVTNLVKYKTYFESKRTNKNAQKIRIKDIEPEEESTAKREFNEFAVADHKTAEFIKFISENLSVINELAVEEHSDLTQILSDLLQRLGKRKWSGFLGWKEINMLNSAIEKFRSEVERKTGTPALPTTTGFRDHALNRISIEINASEIIKGIDTKIPAQTEIVGSLGKNKRGLEYRTEFQFHDGSVSDGSLFSLAKVKKTLQKEFVACVKNIQKNSYSTNLFELIADLNEIDEVEGIKTVHELLLFRRFFSLDGKKYSPSSGESSMVMLQKELGTEKDVYILDEPERSLGNEYISEVIVPMIKERARAGKIIFISTHDANVAVRTLPYNSIYRCHGESGYSTYVGNPFTSDLISLNDVNDRLDWKKISMKTLEGGEEAFGERGNIYGSS